jgi:hypothetical protein
MFVQGWRQINSLLKAARSLGAVVSAETDLGVADLLVPGVGISQRVVRVDERDDERERLTGGRLFAAQKGGSLVCPAAVIVGAASAEVFRFGVLSAIGRLPGMKTEFF